MRWKSGRRSSNVIDARGSRRSRVPGGRPTKVGGGAIIIALIAIFVFGQDPLAIISQLFGGAATSSQVSQPAAAPGQFDEEADFTKVVLADTEDAWGKLFAEAGSRYREPELVLYSGAVQSACGYNTAATGPFYCPGDDRIYIDLSFLNELRRMGAPGDFAFAYVIAHEVGHHIQNITGINQQVRQQQQRVGQVQRNQLQVAMELQADCYAGVWAHHGQKDRNILEPGDVQEGLAAAAAVGDDRLQKAAGRRVQPETWTHGSSAQRMEWFQRGFQTGDYDACNTFG